MTDPADPAGQDDDLDDDETSALPAELLGAGNPLEAIFGGSGGMPDLGSLVEGLGAVQGIQQRSFEGTAGGGLVRIVANGRMEVDSVRIEPGALEGGDEPDVELLADLVLAALHDLTGQIATAQQEAMGPLGGILGQ